MSQSPSAPVPPPQQQQWSCHVCHQPILPPGNPGKVDIAGEHYCNACAELAVLSAPEPSGSGTRVAPMRRSSAGLKRPGSGSGIAPARRSSASMNAPHMMPGSYKGAAIPAWVNLIKPLVILGLLGGLGYWIVTKKWNAPQETEQAAQKDETGDTSASRTRDRRERAGAPEQQEKPVKKPVEPARKPDVPVSAPVAPPREPAQVAPATPPKPSVSEADLTGGLERAVTMIKDSRYGGAKKLLAELNEQHAGKEWWGRNEKNWTDTDTELRQQLKEFQDEAKDARESLQEKPSREMIERVLEAWRKYADSEDELTGELARQILHEASRARLKVIEESRVVRLRTVEDKLTEFEKVMKSRPGSRQQEEMLKFLDELDEEILANPAWEERLAPRVIGLRFDVKRARDGDLLIYRAVTKTRGAVAELLYDFETPDQMRAWSYSAPTREDASHATWDATTKSVVLRADGMHDWKGKERQGMPFFCLPMDFQSWTVEADLDVREIGSTTPPADFGLLAWQGGTNVLLFGFREQVDKKGAKEWLFRADGCLEKDAEYEKDLARIPEPEKKNVKLLLAYSGGSLAFGAAVGSRPLAIQQRVRLPFKPNFLGLYVRTRGSGASLVAFDSVKIAGVPDMQALRSKVDLARQIEVNTAKDEWRKQAQAARVARDQSAGLIPQDWPSGWTCAGAEACTQFPDRPNAKQTRPTKPAALPCWSRKVKLEPYKTHYVHADVSAPQGVDWGAAVRVNGKEIASQIVTGPGWQMLDVDLTPYGGDEITLEIVNRPAGAQDGETAFWDRVYIGSR